ncbi:MAG: peptidoglycan recognition family protein [Planctomycetota bacterium]
MKRLGTALALLLVLVGCTTTGSFPAESPPPPPFVGASTHSWDKLAELEAWLDGPGPSHYPDKRPQAELALAEGRLNFAKKDGTRLPAATLARRVAAAEAGFRRVLSDPEASSLERRRARTGLDNARDLRAPRPAQASTTAVRTRSTWGARPSMPGRLTPQRGRYTRITVHHSAPPQPLPVGASAAVYADEIRRLQRYHMDQVTPRCGDIGYHFLIDPNGAIYEGRSLRWQGAHAGGSNNVDNIGICVLGDFRHKLPTEQALATLERLIEDLRTRQGIPRDSRHIVGHQELKATACPGDRLMGWLERYR